MSDSAQQRLLKKAPRAKRPTQRSEHTRDAILAAALELVWEKSFHDLTVGEVMARAGQSRPAFYQYVRDLHEVMEALLLGLQQDIFEAAAPWFSGEGDPKALLTASLEGLVRVCYDLGPVVRAVSDAQVSDERLAATYAQFLGKFDKAVAARIRQHQRDGWIASFEAYPVAVALNRLDAAMMIHAFGRRPRAKKKPVLDALVRIWSATLYGSPD